MATRRTTFEKQQRERTKKAKAAAKRDRRLEAKNGDEPGEDDAAEQSPVPHDSESVAGLFKAIDELQRQFEGKELAWDEYEKKKAILLAQLPIG